MFENGRARARPDLDGKRFVHLNGKHDMLIARRSVLIGLGLAGLVPAAAAAALEIVEAGTVETVTGESIGKLRGEKRALAVGSPVFIEDLLQTSVGARLGVKLGEATRISLGESTHLRIDKFLVDRGGELVLEGGAIRFDRPSDKPSGQLTVTTPFGLIAARGTKFFAGPSGGVFGVFVEHGLVTVKTKRGSVTLTDGLGTNMTGLKAAPSPAAPWPDERIALAIASVS